MSFANNLAKYMIWKNAGILQKSRKVKKKTTTNRFVFFQTIAQVTTVSFGLCACSVNPSIRGLSCLTEPLLGTAHTLLHSLIFPLT